MGQKAECLSQTWAAWQVQWQQNEAELPFFSPRSKLRSSPNECGEGCWESEEGAHRSWGVPRGTGVGVDRTDAAELLATLRP